MERKKDVLRKLETKKKLLLSIISIMLVLFTSIGVTYAYWDYLSTNQSEVVIVGEGTNIVLEVEAVAPVGKTLVPENVVLGLNDVDNVVLTYNVKLDKELTENLNLSVLATDILIGGESTYSYLVNIDIVMANNLLNNSNVLVTVTVTLTEPETYEIYEIIKNGEITFDLMFSAS